MPQVVSDTTAARNPCRGIFAHAVSEGAAIFWGMTNKSRHRPTFIRQWRQHKGLSLDQLADRVPMDKSNLSKVERGILPYNQEMLERIAYALMTDPASLLMRDPSDKSAMWSIWDQASPGERAQIESVANALISTRKAG